MVIDEAQDLDPTVLRLLVTLCKFPNRVFLAADANQSIYGSGFRWADVHEDLHFRGRTETLWVNQRSTREIGEAAWAYLGTDGLDEVMSDRAYAQSGEKPLLCRVHTEDEEVKFLAEYLPATVRDLRLGLGCCAVLVPTHAAGQALAMRLRGVGIPTLFMTSKELDLERPVVKILPLKSAKGLEFPVVILAGFLNVRPMEYTNQLDAEERQERLGYTRRTVFVAMSRAMRVLAVVIPDAETLPQELQGFDHALWTNYAPPNSDRSR